MRVLSRLVDDVATQRRDGAEWLTLVLSGRAGCSSLGGDLLDEAASRLGTRGPGDVGLGEDPDQTSIGDDRQASHLLGCHPLQRVVE